MEYILENDDLQIKVSDNGAELLSLISKKNKDRISMARRSRILERSRPPSLSIYRAVKRGNLYISGTKLPHEDPWFY